MKHMHPFHFFMLLSSTWFFLSMRTSPKAYADGYHYSYNCTTSNSTFESYSAYHKNLETLLSLLSSKATTSSGSYYTRVSGNSIVSDSVYGLFQCNGDVLPETCQKCIDEAVNHITALCATSRDAMIFVEFCFLRYSYLDFFSTVQESPRLFLLNELNYAGDQVGSFNSKLLDMMNDLRARVANIPLGSRRFAYMAVNITDNQTLYGMAKCTPDLVRDNCSWCIGDAIAEIPTGCCKGKVGGRVLFPSCGLRFELYQFYQPSALLLTPPPPLAEGKGKKGPLVLAAVIVANVVSLLLLYCGGSCFLRRQRQRKIKAAAVLKESFEDELLANLESLRFEYSEIEAATNKFSEENKIGRGGFGEVYKGILLGGQEIAVKRLLGNSWQGAEEFKNEVLVIAKLQHKNLVKLLGFCLEGQEKILVYEYLPNRSLNYVLFVVTCLQNMLWMGYFL